MDVMVVNVWLVVAKEDVEVWLVVEMSSLAALVRAIASCFCCQSKRAFQYMW
jgi:hypothetical protein